MSSVQHWKSVRQAPVVRTALEKARADVRADMEQEARVLLTKGRRTPRTQQKPRQIFASEALFDGKASWWSVPAVGGCIGGSIIGKAMAESYLKSIQTDDHLLVGLHLEFVIQSITWRIAEVSGQNPKLRTGKKQSVEELSLINQRLGFMREIARMVVLGLQAGGHRLYNVPDSETARRVAEAFEEAGVAA